MSVAFLFNEKKPRLSPALRVIFELLGNSWQITQVPPAPTLNRRLPALPKISHQPRKFRGWFCFQEM